ncbi:hypothetical protein AHIS1636_35680 [Arthrobacter mangrovi]|uniref:Uncharacterized protein n=1 Tax=Arthrobacter mangrovi TaxID=2966350 RepID=A0ABQ5MYQ2_9MICC|nr:hypothetical protein AHIS1636_35680 [Arthrobacter mangrovi]
MRTALRGDYRLLFTLDAEEDTLYVYRIAPFRPLQGALTCLLGGPSSAVASSKIPQRRAAPAVVFFGVPERDGLVELHCKVCIFMPGHENSAGAVRKGDFHNLVDRCVQETVHALSGAVTRTECRVAAAVMFGSAVPRSGSWLCIHLPW